MNTNHTNQLQHKHIAMQPNYIGSTDLIVTDGTSINIVSTMTPCEDVHQWIRLALSVCRFANSRENQKQK